MEANEEVVRNALLGLLRQGGLEPQGEWVHVRRVKDTQILGGMYLAIVSHPDARAVLSQVFRPRKVGVETDLTGVWILNETEVRTLCGS